nr:hypothetical protein Iba_chr14cCG11570 [Ipomoea batatas]
MPISRSVFTSNAINDSLAGWSTLVSGSNSTPEASMLSRFASASSNLEVSLSTARLELLCSSTIKVAESDCLRGGSEDAVNSG